MGLLTGPHYNSISCVFPEALCLYVLTQISFSDEGSFTIRLSKGDRPVFAPEYAVRAPLDVMAEPVS